MSEGLEDHMPNPIAQSRSSTYALVNGIAGTKDALALNYCTPYTLPSSITCFHVLTLTLELYSISYSLFPTLIL